VLIKHNAVHDVCLQLHEAYAGELLVSESRQTVTWLVAFITTHTWITIKQHKAVHCGCFSYQLCYRWLLMAAWCSG